MSFYSVTKLHVVGENSQKITTQKLLLAAKMLLKVIHTLLNREDFNTHCPHLT